MQTLITLTLSGSAMALLLLMTAMHERLCKTVDEQASAPRVS